MADNESQRAELNLRWERSPETPPAVSANQLAVQTSPTGEVYLVVGQVAPPLLLGDEEAKRATVEELRASGLPVQIVGQFAISPQVLIQWAALLQEHVLKHFKPLLDQMQ